MFISRENIHGKKIPPKHDGIFVGIVEGCVLFAFQHLENIEQEWKTLEKIGCFSPFQTFDWISAIKKGCDQSGSPRDSNPLFLVGYVDTRPVIILPFDIRAGKFGRYLTWLGERASDYNGAIIDQNYAKRMSKGIVEKMIKSLRKCLPQIQAVHLIRNRSGLFDENSKEQSGLISRSAEFKSHALMLDKDWKSLYSDLRSSKSRQRLRSKYRSLSKLGSVRFKQVRNPEARKELVQTILDWKSSQLQKNGRRDPFGKAQSPSSIRKTIEHSTVSDSKYSLKVFGLFLNDQPIGGMLAFISADTFYYYVSVHSSEVSGKYSVGLQLLVKTLELAARSGLKKYDFLIGDEHYKSDWCNVEIPIYNHSMHFTLRGKLIDSIFRARLNFKNLVMKNTRLRRFARQILRYVQKPGDELVHPSDRTDNLPMGKNIAHSSDATSA